jgi:O-antigen ligase
MPATIVSLAAEQECGSKRTDPTLRGIGLFTAATLLAAPLAFGAVQPWAWGLLAAAACAAVVGWAFQNLRRRHLSVIWPPLLIPGAGLLVFGVAQLFGGISRDPSGAREALIKLATDLVFVFVVTQVVVETERQPSAVYPGSGFDALGLCVSVYAFALALFAVLQSFSSHARIYWRVRAAGWTFGPYVNHNHYAGLMEMLIPVAASYAFSRPKSQAGRPFLFFAVVVAAVSLLLSGSRGGFVSLAAEALIFGVMLWRWPRGLRRRRMAGAALMAVAAVAVLFFWLDPGRISKRLVSVAGLAHSPEVTLGERAVVARNTLGLFRQHLWFGTGLGSFQVAYSQVQGFATDLVYDHAHNDYAEALAETGLTGGILIAAALLIFFRLAWRNVRSGFLLERGWMRLGAFLGCAGLLVHSLVDFNLHIPANALWFSALATVAATSSVNVVQDRESERQ